VYRRANTDGDGNRYRYADVYPNRNGNCDSLAYGRLHTRIFNDEPGGNTNSRYDRHRQSHR
jgi:hypothetical protein